MNCENKLNDEMNKGKSY